MSLPLTLPLPLVAAAVSGNAGLLGRCWFQQRPSVAPSARSLGGDWGGYDHADGTPAACFVDGGN